MGLVVMIVLKVKEEDVRKLTSEKKHIQRLSRPVKRESR